eukprot:3982910-Alexandrium_andersonii.AAC.1
MGSRVAKRGGTWASGRMGRGASEGRAHMPVRAHVGMCIRLTARPPASPPAHPSLFMLVCYYVPTNIHHGVHGRAWLCLDVRKWSLPAWKMCNNRGA